MNIIVKTGGGVGGDRRATFSSHFSWALNHELRDRVVVFQGEQSGESST